jgi:hypothetical protein
MPTAADVSAETPDAIAWDVSAGTPADLTATAARFSTSAGKPIFGMARIEAMAWAATTMPGRLLLNRQGVRALRRSGIPPSSRSGRH